MDPQISIVIPAFDEASRLSEPLERVVDYLKTEKVNAELLVVDDGSSDDTAATAEATLKQHPEICYRVLSYTPNRGKGYAVRAGLKESRAPVAIFSDSSPGASAAPSSAHCWSPIAG